MTIPRIHKIKLLLLKRYRRLIFIDYTILSFLYEFWKIWNRNIFFTFVFVGGRISIAIGGKRIETNLSRDKLRSAWIEHLTRLRWSKNSSGYTENWNALNEIFTWLQWRMQFLSGPPQRLLKNIKIYTAISLKFTYYFATSATATSTSYNFV